MIVFPDSFIELSAGNYILPANPDIRFKVDHRFFCHYIIEAGTGYRTFVRLE